MNDLRSALYQYLRAAFWVAVTVVLTWWLTPEWKIKYALRYEVDRARIVIEDHPTDCDWSRAPLGYKACHYEKVVSTVQWSTSTTGQPIISYDEGKTWSVFTPDAGTMVPKYPKVQSVYVSWQKKNDP